MFESSVAIKKPKFRHGVEFQPTEGSVNLNYKNRGCAIDRPNKNSEDLDQLLRCLLKGGYTTEELIVKFPTFGEEIEHLISDSRSEFDPLLKGV